MRASPYSNNSKYPGLPTPAEATIKYAIFPGLSIVTMIAAKPLPNPCHASPTALTSPGASNYTETHTLL